MTMLKINQKKMFYTLAALPFAMSSLAQAVVQENSKSDVNQGIEVIQVTSEKRVSTLQETPIAVSAFNTSELARQGIEEAADIQFAIPNAMLTDRGTFNIRGVGNSARSSTAESGTGVHYNGIYLTRPSVTNEYFDLQSIEVLRGPQGTLYGRNTTAGVVNIMTQRPVDDFEGHLTVEASNFNSLRTIGAVNFAISDSIKQRFAFNTVSRDGFTENISTGEDIDGRSQFSIRSTTAFEFSEHTNATLFAQYHKEDSDRSLRRGVRCKADAILGCSATETGHDFVNSDYTDGNFRNTLFGTLGALSGFPEPYRSALFPKFNQVAGSLIGNLRPDFYNNDADGNIKVNPDDPRKVNIDNKPQIEADELLLSLEINHEIDSGTFTSITAYQDTSSDGVRDYDNSNGSEAFINPVSYVFDDNTRYTGTGYNPVQTFDISSEQISQEFRFVSALESDFNYTAGVYWLNYKSDSHITTFLPYLSMLGDLLGLPDEVHGFSTDTPEVETTSWAVFGEVYYDLTDKLKLTAGMRYSNEEKSQKSQTVSPLHFVGGITALLADPASFTANREILVESVKNTFEVLDNDWQETTGKLGLSYQLDTDLTDETLFFGTLARGYKAGGLNPGGASQKAFDAEYINSIELGTKNTFWDRSFQANVTTFVYDYQDIQLGAIEQGGATITDNADAAVKGIEFEFVAVPIPDVMINLNVSLLDTEITSDFETPDGTQLVGTPPISIKGNTLPYAPEKSVQFGIQYSHEVFDNWEITYLAQAYWQDEFNARVYNTAPDSIGSWSQTDITVSLTDAYDEWRIEAFVKNVGNNDSVTGLSAENSSAGRFRLPAILDPRQFGIRVHYRFE
jgi:outer membrane receptor protein involved in Fe transport